MSSSAAKYSRAVLLGIISGLSGSGSSSGTRDSSVHTSDGDGGEEEATELEGSARAAAAAHGEHLAVQREVEGAVGRGGVVESRVAIQQSAERVQRLLARVERSLVVLGGRRQGG